MNDIPEFTHQPLTDPGSQIRVLYIFPDPSDAPLRLGIGLEDLHPKHTLKYNALSYAWGDSGKDAEVEIRLRFDPDTQCVHCGCEMRVVNGKFKHPVDLELEKRPTFRSKMLDIVSRLKRKQDWRKRILDRAGCQKPWLLVEGQDIGSLGFIEANFTVRRKLRINSNLEKALRQLRQPKSTWIAWADGICINQEDDHEKSYQVRNMDRVYEGAERTTLWLGASADDSDLAVDLVNEFSKYERRESAYCKERDYDWEAFFQTTHSWTRHWEALNKLMARPWFQRRWVIQEVVLSTGMEVRCGDRTLVWCNLWRVSMFLLGGKDFQSPISTPVSNDVHTAIHRVHSLHEFGRHYNHGRETYCPIMTLEQLCFNFFTSLCKDKRDIIYSLLSLARDVDRQVLWPDYSESTTVVDVFVQCFKTIVDRSQSLDFMFRANHSPKSNVETWLPCLGGFARLCDCGSRGGDEGRIHSFLGSRYKPESEKPKASLSTPPSYHIQKTNGSFTLIALGHMFAPVSFAGNGEESWKEDEKYIEFQKNHGAEDDVEWARFLELMKDVGPGVDHLKPATVVLCNGPGQRGDIVCVIFGCSSPVILRPTTSGSSEFYFICSCEVEGVMNGEFMTTCLQNNVLPQEFRIR